MPPKRRRAKLQREVRITPRAIELYELMEQRPERDDEWWEWHELLCKEVGAKLWEFPLDSAECAAHIWDALTAAAERQWAEKVAAAK